MRWWALLLLVLAGLSLTLAAAWAVQQRTGKSGWVDTIWTYAVGVAGAVLALAPLEGDASPSARHWLVATLVALWSLRLGTHVAQRTFHARGDDPRYARIAEGWGDRAPWMMFWFLQLQALAAMLLAVAAFVAARAPRPELTLADWLGAAILLGAIAGEATADAQVKAFGQDPANKGRVCDVGLWRWSRHPNYFFEWLGWVAYPVIAIQLAGYPYGWIAIIGPAYMYYLLVHVSGIPPLEEHMLRTRGDAFRAYQAKTSAFFPMPPKGPTP